MEQISVYETIKAAIGPDGRLTKDVPLGKQPAPNELHFAAGARDGIEVYHFGSGSVDEKTIEVILGLLTKYRKGDKRTTRRLESIVGEHHTLSFIDQLLPRITPISNQKTDQKVLFAGIDLAQTSSDVELVKMGLSIMGLFDLGAVSQICDEVAVLAAHDELTLYAVEAVRHWTGGNDFVFRIAQSVDGWGKIHAVERLEPANDEIRDWILRHGCTNEVMDSYLGLTCAKKGDMITALRQPNLDHDLYESISVIVSAMLDEGPVVGISVYEHANEALQLYIGHAKQQATTVADLWRLLALRSWAEENPGDENQAIIEGCDSIVENGPWEARIKETVNQHDKRTMGNAFNAAQQLGVDISSEMMAAIRDKPVEFSYYASRLLKDPRFAPDILELYESVLPLDALATGMGDDQISPTLFEENQALEWMLWMLGDLPGQGTKLILTGLNSRLIRMRHAACHALQGWTESENKPLADISPEIAATVGRISAIEVEEQNRQAMHDLIEGSNHDRDHCLWQALG